jgi:hypothetical protein
MFDLTLDISGLGVGYVQSSETLSSEKVDQEARRCI